MAGKVSVEIRVVLIGLRATGKSSVGAALAQQLGARFFDSDLEIERSTSLSPARWIEERGEQEFRRAEAQVVQRLSHSPAPVVLALGGGAPLAAESRQALKRWSVICLDAPSEELARRVEKDRLTGHQRPPLTNFPLEEEIDLQRKQRWADYMSMFPQVVAVGSDSPEVLADQLVKLLASAVRQEPVGQESVNQDPGDSTASLPSAEESSTE